MSPTSVLHAGDDAVKQSGFGASKRAKQNWPGEIEMNMVPLKMQSIALNRKQVSRLIALRETLNKQGIHCVAGRMESPTLVYTASNFHP